MEKPQRYITINEVSDKQDSDNGTFTVIHIYEYKRTPKNCGH